MEVFLVCFRHTEETTVTIVESVQEVRGDPPQGLKGEASCRFSKVFSLTETGNQWKF